MQIYKCVIKRLDASKTKCLGKELNASFCCKIRQLDSKVYPRFLLPSLFDEFNENTHICMSKKYDWNRYMGENHRFLHWHFIYLFNPEKLLWTETIFLWRFVMGILYSELLVSHRTVFQRCCKILEDFLFLVEYWNL